MKIYNIPYDMDFFWNGGCEGRDFLADEYGDSVFMLISDSGSAFFCPEGRSERWRIYIDSSGREWRLGDIHYNTSITWAGQSIFDPSFQDIISCALSMYTNDTGIESGLAILFAERSSSPPVRFPTAFEGLSFEIGGWLLTFSDNAITLSDYGFKYIVGESGIPYKFEQWEECGPLGDYGEDICVINDGKFFATPSEATSIADQLRAWLKYKSGIEKIAANVAARIFIRASETTSEINSFENICEYLSDD